MTSYASIDKNYAISNNGDVIHKNSGRSLAQWENKNKNNPFSKPYLRVNCGGKKYYIHRLLAKYFSNTPKIGPYVDHENLECKDNHIGNLRWATGSDNNTNWRKFKLNHKNRILKSKWKGVTFAKTCALGKQWQAHFQYRRKRYYSYHSSEEDAAIGYNKLALTVNPSFARLNVI